MSISWGLPPPILGQTIDKCISRRYRVQNFESYVAFKPQVVQLQQKCPYRIYVLYLFTVISLANTSTNTYSNWGIEHFMLNICLLTLTHVKT